MPLTVVATQSYGQYSAEIDKFAVAVPARAEYSEERAGGRESADPKITRCIAYLDGTIVGWMILKMREGDLRVEGICTHTDEVLKKGVGKALLTYAMNMAIRSGKGTMTLFDASKGSGSGLYTAFGFEATDTNGNMHMAISAEFR
jgi:hypothetical protein